MNPLNFFSGIKCCFIPETKEDDTEKKFYDNWEKGQKQVGDDWERYIQEEILTKIETKK